MALVTKSASPSGDAGTLAFAPQVSGLIAGEDLEAVSPCYIKTSDGKVYMSNGTAATEPAEFVGFTPVARKATQPVTLFGVGARFNYYSTGLLPGDKLYIGATSGRLDTAATTGDAVGVAQAITATDIRVTRNI